MTKELFRGVMGSVKFLSPLVALVLVCGFVGCNLKEKYAINNQKADQWLQANRGAVGANVNGSWEAHEFGWGGIRFEQNGSRVTGAMGNYTVRGVVRGSRVYLALSSGDWVHYTAVLRANGNVLAGFYSPSVPFSSNDQAAVTLRRIGN